MSLVTVLHKTCKTRQNMPCSLPTFCLHVHAGVVGQAPLWPLVCLTCCVAIPLLCAARTSSLSLTRSLSYPSVRGVMEWVEMAACISYPNIFLFPPSMPLFLSGSGEASDSTLKQTPRQGLPPQSSRGTHTSLPHPLMLFLACALPLPFLTLPALRDRHTPGRQGLRLCLPPYLPAYHWRRRRGGRREERRPFPTCLPGVGRDLCTSHSHSEQLPRHVSLLLFPTWHLSLKLHKMLRNHT